MRADDPAALSGEIFDDRAALTVEELSRLCSVDRTFIVELVEEGVLSVTELRAGEWRFAGAALRRARTAARLQRDLEINLPGVALVLQLMEELDRLRRELGMQSR
jgi:chaperone modulatory protein CbpM